MSNLNPPLRLWPAVLLVSLQWLGRFALPVVAPDAAPFGVLGALIGGLLLGAWWLLMSRAPWSERLRATVIVVVASVGSFALLHESMAGGAMGLLYPIYALPTISLGFVVWAGLFRRSASRPRLAALVVATSLAAFGWTLVRTEGFDGRFDNDFAWRWSPTHEETLLARDATAEFEPVSDSSAESPTPLPAIAAWPGFRGPGRDGVISTESTGLPTSSAQELWRRDVGPGWSSFAVCGDRVYTQEQRGDDEAVSCHDLGTGALVWRHLEPTRFWEANAGAGPRATPTVRDGRVHALGATGIAHALDAVTGEVLWRRDAAQDTGATRPGWGFAGSPLVVDELVVHTVAGHLIAYELATGELRWNGPTSGGGYSSAQLMSIDGVEQIVLQSEAGITGVAVVGGGQLWHHAWPGDPIVQPARTLDGDLLVSVSDRSGVRRLNVARVDGEWQTTEVWTSVRLKPYFNDFVVLGDHAFGFDSGVLTCVGLKDGRRRWKDGRFGHGQLALLQEPRVLVVLSEEGEVLFVDAVTEGLNVRHRFQAIDGKTWNHPVVVDDVLLVRNAQEMAAFRLGRSADGVSVGAVGGD